MRTVQRLRGEQGVALIFVLIMLGVMTMIGLGITGLGMVATTVTVNAGETAGALAIADAGVAHARRLIMWQEWPSLNGFLQNGNGTACDGDELSVAPAGAPAGFPAAAGDLITAAGTAFGGGTYQVFVCDDHATDINPTTGVLDVDPNTDVNRRIIVRSVGVGANGATATVEQIYGSQDLPAVIINGNILAQGNTNFSGAGGAIHGNGNLAVAGNTCAQQYYSAVGTTAVTGGSVGGGAGCTGAAVDLRPDSPPINVPVLQPGSYKPQATYWLENNGTCVIHVPATGVTTPTACAALGWSYSAGTNTWSGGSSILAGAYWINGNVDLTGSPGSPATPLPLTILAEGWVDISGSPDTTPALSVAGLGLTNVGLSVVAGTDLRMRGSSTQVGGAVYYARHQIDLAGTPNIDGQLMAANVADTAFPVGTGTNLVPLNGAGQMVITGNATISFGGNGAQALRALQWRECRTSNDPANPCGALYGG